MSGACDDPIAEVSASVLVMMLKAVPLWLLGATMAVAACQGGGELGSERAGLRPATRILDDGEIVLTSTGTCQLDACRVCPGISYADVIVADGATVDVVCYPTEIDVVVTPRGSESLNINAGDDAVAIDLSELPDHTLFGDININAAGDTSIFGSTSTPTVVRGNVNIHTGDARLYNLIVEGDVSINDNNNRSALVDVVVRGNLNVHVPRFTVVRSDVFGDLNINRAASTIVSVGFGQNRNIHGRPLFCRDLRAFFDANGDGLVETSERSDDEDACPSGDTLSRFDLSVIFDDAGLDVFISGGSGTFDFGMAETGSVFPGWFGEACIDEETDDDLCHRGVGRRFRLTSVTSSSDVVPTMTTLFDRFNRGGITFVIFDGAQCYASGNDPSFYPDCVEL